MTTDELNEIRGAAIQNLLDTTDLEVVDALKYITALEYLVQEHKLLVAWFIKQYEEKDDNG